MLICTETANKALHVNALVIWPVLPQPPLVTTQRTGPILWSYSPRDSRRPHGQGHSRSPRRSQPLSQQLIGRGFAVALYFFSPMFMLHHEEKNTMISLSGAQSFREKAAEARKEQEPRLAALRPRQGFQSCWDSLPCL